MNIHRQSSLALVPATAILLGAFAQPADALGLLPDGSGAVIEYGDSFLGVNDLGHLNIYDPAGPDGPGTYGIWRRGVGDATSPGCLCEGWGVAVTTASGGRTAGFANESAGTGGLTGGTFGATTTTATSSVGLSGAPVTITHAYGPSLVEGVFQGQVTITNNGTETLTDVVYRRAMDWDVPPTEFNEYVTHGGVEANLESNGGNVRYASDNGFASSDPRDPAEWINPETVNSDFVDNGPSDHGSVFDFAFGDLAPGESRIFNIFYGTMPDEASAMDAIATLGAEVYSLGQSNPDPDIYYTSGGWRPDFLTYDEVLDLIGSGAITTDIDTLIDAGLVTPPNGAGSEMVILGDLVELGFVPNVDALLAELGIDEAWDVELGPFSLALDINTVSALIDGGFISTDLATLDDAGVIFYSEEEEMGGALIDDLVDAGYADLTSIYDYLGYDPDASGSGPGNADGTPATFLFAFGGVGGVEPGATPDEPVLPFVPAEGTFEFPAPTPRRWFDPPFVEGFEIVLEGSDPALSFTSVIAPPASMGFGTIDIVIGGTVVASLDGGESFDFAAAGYTDVTSFTVSGIDPLLDMADPGYSSAFPLWLDWSGTADTMRWDAIIASTASVPEPSTLVLMGLGLAGLAAARRRKTLH